jgi:hypothetical protein
VGYPLNQVSSDYSFAVVRIFVQYNLAWVNLGKRDTTTLDLVGISRHMEAEVASSHPGMLSGVESRKEHLSLQELCESFGSFFVLLRFLNTDRQPLKKIVGGGVNHSARVRNENRELAFQVSDGILVVIIPVDLIILLVGLSSFPSFPR